MLGRSDVRYTEATWAEDRATRGRDPSADPGAKTGVGGRTPPLGIPGIGRNALNPLTSCVISECGSDDSACPVHAEPVRPQAPRASRLHECSTGMRHAYIFKVVQRAPFLLASHAVRHMSGFQGAVGSNRGGTPLHLPPRRAPFCPRFTTRTCPHRARPHSGDSHDRRSFDRQGFVPGSEVSASP